MTDSNLTSLNVILDASGSMGSLTTDTIGSFNTFLAEQKAFPGEALFSLAIFNTDYRLVHDCAKIHNVPSLTVTTYHPTGGTALLDAVGKTIDEVGAKLAALPENQRPGKVLFLIITDGEENSSRRYKLEEVKSKIEHQRQVYSWEFVFIGANIDAISTGTNLGISAQNSVGYVPSAAGTHQLYSSVSSNTSAYRSSRTAVAPDFFGQTGITPTTTVVGGSTNSIPTSGNNITSTPNKSVKRHSIRDYTGRFTRKA